MSLAPLIVRGIGLISAGDVSVRHADADQGRVMAVVQGRTGGYVVRRSAGGVWTCTCMAGSFSTQCHHVVAVALVTTGVEEQ